MIIATPFNNPVGWLVFSGGTLAAVGLSPAREERGWVSWDAAQILTFPKLFQLPLGTDMEAKGAKREDFNVGDQQSFCKWWVEKKNFLTVQSYMLILWILGQMCIKKMLMGIAVSGVLKEQPAIPGILGRLYIYTWN